MPGRATLSRLPGGDSKIRQQQTRLLARIQELRDVGGLGEGLSKTTIASEDGKTVVDDVMEFQAKGMDNEAFEDVKPAIVHGEMERVPEDDPSTSPLVKRRLAARQVSLRVVAVLEPRGVDLYSPFNCASSRFGPVCIHHFAFNSRRSISRRVNGVATRPRRSRTRTG